MNKLNTNDRFQPMLDNISDFLKDYSFRFDRDIVDPEDLHFAVSRDRYGDELYYENIFQQFVSHAKGMDFDLYSWDRKENTETFEQKLINAVEDFNYYISPTVYKGTIYFIRCKPKIISGLPNGFDNREYFFENKTLFTYDSYSIKEDDLFKLVGNYTHLYKEYKTLLERKSTITLIAVILGFVVFFLIYGLFMT